MFLVRSKSVLLVLETWIGSYLKRFHSIRAEMTRKIN